MAKVREVAIEDTPRGQTMGSWSCVGPLGLAPAHRGKLPFQAGRVLLRSLRCVLNVQVRIAD